MTIITFLDMLVAQKFNMNHFFVKCRQNHVPMYNNWLHKYLLFILEMDIGHAVCFENLYYVHYLDLEYFQNLG